MTQISSPALPPTGVRLQREVDRAERPRAHDAERAHADRVQALDPLAPDVPDARALGAEQPLVTIRGERVNRRLLNINREDAQPLNRVHEEDAALAAEFAQRVEVVPEAAGELDRVLASILARMSSIATRLPRLGTVRTSTPRCARFIHGYWFAGYSSAARTTLSPACHGNPSAITPIPKVVFGTKYTSSGSGELMSFAASRRTCASRAAHSRKAVTPLVARLWA